MSEPTFKRNTWANLAQATAPQKFSRKETQDMNRQALAVVPQVADFDESGSAFFAPEKGGAGAMTDEELGILDSLIEQHGLANILKAVGHLLESRIEEGMIANGRMLLHLSRDDAWARAAERLQEITFHPDISGL